MNIDFSSFNNQKMPTSALTEKRVMETDQDINTQSQVSHYYEGGKRGGNAWIKRDEMTMMDHCRGVMKEVVCADKSMRLKLTLITLIS